jgi:hypothetical protein
MVFIIYNFFLGGGGGGRGTVAKWHGTGATHAWSVQYT